MITTYLDKDCKTLKASQGLKLSDDCSALWFCAEKGDDLSCLLRFMISTFNSLSGFFWLAFSGGAGNSKILNMKRAFGQWSIPKSDVVSKHDLFDEDGNKLYSDIAQIKDGNVEAFSPIINRHLFGIDSTLFFLSDADCLLHQNVAGPLTDLLIRRNSLEVIDEELQSYGFIEDFVAEVVALGGVATITLRDSNMCTMVVAIGNQFALNRTAKSLEKNSLGSDWKHIDNEPEFISLLKVGISISALG